MQKKLKKVLTKFLKKSKLYTIKFGNGLDEIISNDSYLISQI